VIEKLTLAALIGLCLGSFAATAALRQSRSRQAVFGRSSCDDCGSQLSYLQTLPVLGFVGARGQCAQCGGSIDPVHLIGEIGGAAVLALSFGLFPPLQALALSALGLILLSSAIVDAKTQRLPDGLTFAAAGLCAILAASETLARLVQGLISAVLAFAVLEALRRGFWRVRGQPGLGFGDVKLVAALAVWLGTLTPWAVAIAALIGLLAMKIVKPASGRLAFGPALALAGWGVGVAQGAQRWPGLS
jgi:leader peptidase (prepilin peptidase)/N-methyltransferase